MGELHRYHRAVVRDMLWNRDRLAAVRAARDEGLESGVLEGEDLAEVSVELYWASVSLDAATDHVRELGLDPDNLPEEYLP